MSWYFFVFLYAVFKVHCPINPKRRWKFAFLTRVSIDWFTCLHTTGQLCHKVSCQHFWLIFISHMKSEASFKSHITGKVTPAFLPDVYHIYNSTSLLIGWSRSPLSPCPYLYKTISQRPPPVSSPVPSFLFEVGGHLPSHTVSSAVLSAVLGLTVVFGMGTGVSPKRIATGNFRVTDSKCRKYFIRLWKACFSKSLWNIFYKRRSRDRGTLFRGSLTLDN